MDYHKITSALAQTTELEMHVFSSQLQCIVYSPNTTVLLQKSISAVITDFTSQMKLAMITEIPYGHLMILKDPQLNFLVFSFPLDTNQSFTSPARLMTMLQLLYTFIHAQPLSMQDVYLPESVPLDLEDYNDKARGLLLESRVYNLNQDYISELETLAYVREVRFDKIKESFAKLRQANTETIVHDSVLDITIKTICMSTLLARVAIEEHVPVANAFSLSDAVIRTALMQATKADASSYFEASLLYFTELIAKYKYRNYPPHVQKVITYINKHLYEPIRLEALAEHMHYSVWYISRTFKQATGLSINEMIHFLKTSEAKILLRFSQRSSQEIAVQLGYAHHSHFIERFKRIENCTPDQYRRSIGKHKLSNLSDFIETL